MYLFFRIDSVTDKRLFYLNFIDFSINVTIISIPYQKNMILCRILYYRILDIHLD